MNMGEGRYELWFEKEVKEKLTVAFRNPVSNNFPLQQFSISTSLFPSLTRGFSRLRTLVVVLAIYRHNSLLKSQERYHRTAQWRFKCINVLKTKGDLYQPLNMSFSFFIIGEI